MRELCRSPGSDPEVEWARGDLATGDGIADALAGSQTVIHAATLSPAARRGYPVPKDLWLSPAEVDCEGTARLLEKGQRRPVLATSSTCRSLVSTNRGFVPASQAGG